MPVETLTYAALGARLTISAGAARSLAKRLQLPRSLPDDGNVLVNVDLAEIRHTRRPRGSSEAGNVAPLAAKIVALQVRLIKRFLPSPRVLHPWPNHRFNVKHSR